MMMHINDTAKLTPEILNQIATKVKSNYVVTLLSHPFIQETNQLWLLHRPWEDLYTHISVEVYKNNDNWMELTTNEMAEEETEHWVSEEQAQQQLKAEVEEMVKKFNETLKEAEEGE